MEQNDNYQLVPCHYCGKIGMYGKTANNVSPNPTCPDCVACHRSKENLIDKKRKIEDAKKSEKKLQAEKAEKKYTLTSTPIHLTTVSSVD